MNKRQQKKRGKLIMQNLIKWGKHVRKIDELMKSDKVKDIVVAAANCGYGDISRHVRIALTGAMPRLDKRNYL